MKAKEIVDREWRNVKISLENGILTVELDTKGFESNDFDAAVIDELAELAALLHRNTDFNVVLLRGRADVFSFGTAPGVLKKRFSADNVLERRRDTMPGADLAEAWGKIEAITIAAIDGRCRGAAAVLALNCDFRIMGEGAEFFFPEVPAGMILGWSAIPRLVALAGPSRTKRAVLFGEFLDAQTCTSWGLADDVAPKGAAADLGRQWAEKVAKLPPVAVRMTKEAVDSYATALNPFFAAADRNRYLLAGHMRAGLLE